MNVRQLFFYEAAILAGAEAGAKPFIRSRVATGPLFNEMMAAGAAKPAG